MLEFIVSDKTGAHPRATFPNTAHVELLWNQVSFAELTYDDNDPALAFLPIGARVQVLYGGVQYMGGQVRYRSGTGPVGVVTVHVDDDFVQFMNEGWPKPSAAITAQTDAVKTYSGITEDMVKAACTDLSTRLGLGWTVVTSRHAGSTGQRVEFRFDPLTDKFTSLVNKDQLTWSLVNGTVDVVAGTVFPRTLTLDSGVIGDYTWTETAPTATRVVVMGSGDGTSQILRQYVNTTAESAYGFVVESTEDSKLASGVTNLQPDGDAALADGAAKTTITAELNENDWFHLGLYRPGDIVTVDVGAVSTTEVIRKVVIDDTPDTDEQAGGLLVVPSIGEFAGTQAERLTRAVTRLAAGQRKLRRR